MVETLTDDKGLEGDWLGGEVVGPAARETCRYEPDYVSWMPSATNWTRIHLGDRGVCAFLPSSGGIYMSRKGSGDCPRQSRTVYTRTRGVSEDEFLALDAYWRGLVDRGTFSVDAVIARRTAPDPRDREYLEGTRDALRRFSVPIYEIFAESGEELAQHYRLGDAEKSNRFFRLEIAEDRYYFIVMMAGKRIEVIGVGQTMF